MRFKDECKDLGQRTQKCGVAKKTRWENQFHKEDQEFGMGHVRLRLLLENQLKKSWVAAREVSLKFKGDVWI